MTGGVLLGSNGRVFVKRLPTKPFSFGRDNVDKSFNRLINLDDQSLNTGDRVKLYNPSGLPFDLNNDGYSDSPDGHNVYKNVDTTLSPAVFQRSGDSGNFYDSNNNRSQYAEPLNHFTSTQTTLFVSTNELNYVKFYKKWEDSINRKNSIRLFDTVYGLTEVSTVDYENEKEIGEIDNWEFSSIKNEIDISSLGQGFSDKVSGLISGSGSLDVFFPMPTNCPPTDLNYYLFNLLQRFNNGSDLLIYLFLNFDPNSDYDSVNILYYKVNILVTNSSVQLSNDSAVTGSIKFVSVGSYDLCIGNPFIQ